MFNIPNRKENFRIKKMNAIQTLAIRSQIDFDNVKAAEKFFKLALENIEVEIAGSWLPVKTENREVYLPDGIENDLEAGTALTTYFTKDYLMPVFTKSSESKA